MNDGKVSIIIPVYNAEKYITECFNSIQNQTYSNFEAIIINDGSTDRSLSLAEEYASLDNRFKVFSQENKGSSAARNTGLKLAEGEYLAFVDADDWLENNFLEILTGLIRENKADVAVCDFCKNGENEGKWTDGLFDKKQTVHEYLNTRMFNRVMNKIYRREITLDVSFPEGRNYMEDAVWTATIIENVHRTVRTHQALYNYRCQEKSISHIKRKKESVLCGKYRNNIDREIILFNSVDLLSDEDKVKYAYEIISILDELFRTKINTNVYDLFDYCKKLLRLSKELLDQNIKSKTEKALIEDILRIRDGKFVQRRHRARVLCSFRVPMKEKAAIFYRDMNVVKDI